MIHLERTSLLSEGGDTSQYSYQVHVIDSEDKLSQLIALEQQLEITEQRFKRLQNYVDYIRTLYHGSVQDPSSVQICNLSGNNFFPLDLTNSGVNLSSLEDLKNRSFFSDELKDMKAGGDAVFMKELSKDDSLKKKKGAKKKSPIKKTKTPSKRNLQDEPSSRIIERKTRMKIQGPRRTEVREITTVTSSYLKPTVSSQMKKMRPCHPGFNFRSIPFVAGKATTRSHNLGIKIQETLSIIKRNTPAEVGRCTDQVNPELLPPSTANQSNPFSRQSKSECAASRSKCSIASKPVKTKSCSTLSSDSFILDDMNDNAETNSLLKKALLYIQADFTETLNEYKAMTNENNPENAEKIKILEEKLDRKEEVIIAFSKLYNQVHTLRRQLEDPNYHRKKNRDPSAKPNTSNNYPAVKLTRLLRKIQEFQNKIQGYPVV